MPQYQLKFSVTKLVSSWDPEEGADTESKLIDTHEESVVVKQKPSANTVRGLLHDVVGPRYGLRVHDFKYWPDEPGRFTTNRIEDSDGVENPNGRWLADYDVNIEVSTLTPYEPLADHLGFKSVEE